MPKPRRFRAPFVITVASVASVASALGGCGGNTSSDPSGSGGSGNVSGSGGSGNVSGSGGASTGGTGGNPAGCPASFPQGEQPCSAPNGTTCSYDQGDCCPPWQAICQDGKWMGMISSCNPPAPDPCPATPPADGAACGSSNPCGNPYSYCTYGTCADGSPQTIAQCNGSTWQVSFANCLPAACETLTACECFDRPDCQAVTDTCICPCDYNCPGKPPCDCACGGGQYLGCKAIPPP